MNDLEKREILSKIPKYLYPYIGIESNDELSGFWGSLWAGTKSIAGEIGSGLETGASYLWHGVKTGASYLGRGAETAWDWAKEGAEKTWNYTKEGASWSWDKLKQLYHGIASNKTEVTKKGARDIAKHGSNIINKTSSHAAAVVTSHVAHAIKNGTNAAAAKSQGESWLAKIGHAIGNVVGRVTGEVTTYGAEAYAQKLKQKIAKVAKLTGQSQDEIYNKTMAWCLKNQSQLQKMGFSSPDAAVTAVLEHTGGHPPAPNESPLQVFGKTGNASEAGILGNVNPMMLALAGVALFAFMESKKSHDKHNK